MKNNLDKTEQTKYTMSHERYVAAIEISSSKIIGAVGKTDGQGQLDVLAVEQEKGVESVRYGIIQNIEETSLRIGRILDRLQRRPAIAPRKITSLFVGMSGRSMRSVPTEVSLNLPEDTIVTDEILARLRKEALNAALDNTLDVVDAVPRIFKVGKTETTSPKGMTADSIKGVYDLVVCRPELQRNIRRVITDKLDLKIDSFVVTALASSHLILSSEEKRLGCMLVDMGAETTTVCIFKGGYLRYFATLPLGGRNITRDLTSLNLLEERAEDIKLTSGNALPRETASSINLNGLKFSDVSNIIVARSEEIVANVIEQIEYAGLKESDLPGGIILIGGAANLTGISELLGNQSGLQTRMGQLPGYVRIEENRVGGGRGAEVVSILYAGATMTNAECLEMPMQEDLPSTGEPNEETRGKIKKPEQSKQPRFRNPFMSRIKEGIGKIFSAPEDTSDELE